MTEIGAGFGTAAARAAIGIGAFDCILRVIDPEPRIAVERLADDVVLERVEHAPPSPGVARCARLRRTGMPMDLPTS